MTGRLRRRYARLIPPAPGSVRAGGGGCRSTALRTGLLHRGRRTRSAGRFRYSVRTSPVLTRKRLDISHGFTEATRFPCPGRGAGPNAARDAVRLRHCRRVDLRLHAPGKLRAVPYEVAMRVRKAMEPLIA